MKKVALEHLERIEKTIYDVCEEYKTTKCPLNTLAIICNSAKLKPTKKHTENEKIGIKGLNGLIDNILYKCIKRSRKDKVKLRFIRDIFLKTKIIIKKTK
jgi:hypothetical protein